VHMDVDKVLFNADSVGHGDTPVSVSDVVKNQRARRIGRSFFVIETSRSPTTVLRLCSAGRSGRTEIILKVSTIIRPW